MEIFSNFLNEKKTNDQQPEEPSNKFIIRTKGKEINPNINEEKKVKYIKTCESYDLNIQVHGKTIFRDLVITATAKSNNYIIPIKCVWKRVNNETDIYIKDINSSSYMPTAEDIGYIIEIEVRSIDSPKDISIAQYGPIEMDKDMKSAIELLLTSGQTHFNCRMFDPIEQEKVPNREFTLYLGNDEMRLVEVDINRKETLLELCKYSSSNPIIKLNPTFTDRFTLKFMEFNCEKSTEESKGINPFLNKEDFVSRKVKSQYNLIAMSKQCRELIYLIIQFFIIDEKLKNNKIYSLINNINFPSDTKLGIIDLLGQLQLIKEENNKLMKKMKYMEYINRKVSEDIKNLEEDFQFTLEKINGSDMRLGESIDTNNNTNKGISNSNGGSLLNASEWKKKFDELNNEHTTLKAQEKALREEQKEYLLNQEIDKTKLEKHKNMRRELQEENTILKNDLNIISKNNSILNEQNIKLQQQFENIVKVNESLKEQIEQLKENTQQKNEISTLKEDNEKIKKKRDNLLYENKNLLVQINLFTKQISDINKELDKSKLGKNELCAQVQEQKLTIEGFKNSKEENDKLLDIATKNHQKLKDDFNELKNNYDMLKIENKVLQDNYDKALEANIPSNNLSVSINNIKISPDEYEEYDQLKKEKDERDALIMQLETNNKAKDLEIQNLKMIIDNLKSKSN